MGELGGIMLRLRTLITLFFVWLIFFFNIERLAEMVNLASFVYVYVPLVGCLIIFWPKGIQAIGLRMFLVLTLAGFLILKSVLGYEILGSALPLTVTEIFALKVTIYLSNRISHYAGDVEETILNLTFQQVGLSPRLYDSVDTEDLYREVKRCRRFQHPLAMMVIQPEVNSDSLPYSKLLQEMQAVFLSRYVQARVAKLFSDKLRDTDLVVIKNNGLIALLPETAPGDAEELLKKMSVLASRELNIKLNFGLSTFPENSVTLTGLLDYATSDLEGKMQSAK